MIFLCLFGFWFLKCFWMSFSLFGCFFLVNILGFDSWLPGCLSLSIAFSLIFRWFFAIKPLSGYLVFSKLFGVFKFGFVSLSV